MQLNTLFLLVTGLSLCISLNFAQVAIDDCCLMYVRELPWKTKRHVVTYDLQVPDGDCNLPAVILIMRRGRKLCADPKARWVIELMRRIDKKLREAKREFKEMYLSNQRKG